MQKTSEDYKKLYHYTTWDGLLGILQNQTLWATNYKFLNDSLEIVLFKDKLISWLLPDVKEKYEQLIRKNPSTEQGVIEHGGLDQVVQHDTKVVVNNYVSSNWR